MTISKGHPARMAAAALLVAAALALPGCKLLWGERGMSPEGTGGPQGHVGGTPAPIRDWFAAKSMHVQMERDAGAGKGTMTVELWLGSDDRLRVDLYRPGTSEIASTYLSEAEADLTEYRWTDQSINDAPFDTSYFRRGLRDPGVEPVRMGRDRASGAELYKFPVNRAFGRKGSTKRTYVTDIIYGVKGDRVAFYVVYGSGRGAGGPLTQARYDVGAYELDELLDETVFDPPF